MKNRRRVHRLLTPYVCTIAWTHSSERKKRRAEKPTDGSRENTVLRNFALGSATRLRLVGKQCFPVAASSGSRSAFAHVSVSVWFNHVGTARPPPLTKEKEKKKKRTHGASSRTLSCIRLFGDSACDECSRQTNLGDDLSGGGPRHHCAQVIPKHYRLAVAYQERGDTL